MARGNGDGSPPNGRAPHGLLLQWHITERCNFRCLHCYQEQPRAGEPSAAECRTIVGQYMDLCDRLAAAVAPVPFRREISITGGEPFLFGGIFDLLEYLRTLDPPVRVAILTNGSRVDAAVADRLRALRPWFVQVSIDGGRATNDRLRAPGAYHSAVEALRHLSARGIRTSISFTAHRQNCGEFSEVAALGCELGVSRVWTDRQVPWGTGATLTDAVLTPAETRAFFEGVGAARVLAARTFGRTQISLGRALQFLVGGGRPYRCAAGSSLLALLPDGDVFPCRRLPVKVGNVRERSLADIYFENAFLRQLRQATPSRGCERCRFARSCGGGLRCLSYAVTGDTRRADPGCWLACGPDNGRTQSVRGELT